ncbi:MAG TPA: cytochrome ubiquinol oxidase subunit I [Candidatus Eisenbacteria bacterium]|nr:cytochrome ubiquinol oxidase subunit I [Candidatus Eisenbacteria bacterium]
MTDLFAARSQMAISLGFHIVFASIGMAMPFVMAISHWRWLRTKEPVYLDLTKAWSKGVAIFFATGAVSGTVLSFELGLLWPNFMEYAGPISGLPFAWEGTAFFLEAIALGIFLYGWNRVHPWAHWASGVVVGLSGVASALFVICANAWMNAPAGFDWVDGKPINIDPVAAMFNRAALHQGLHMTIAAFCATGYAVAGIHAIGLLKNPASAFHASAFRIAVFIGALAAVVQPLHGDRLAKQTAVLQPAKFAAMESLFRTAKGAPLTIGGIPSEETQTVRYGIEIPGLLSFLAHGDFDAVVPGLDQFPREHWPPIAVTHIAFQIMVGIGVLLAAIGAWSLFALWRRPVWLHSRKALWLFALCTPLGFIAIEAGWTVTEVGRQPWIIYGYMKTSEAVTPMPGLVYPMMGFTAVYLLLAFIVTWLLVRQFRHVG